MQEQKDTQNQNVNLNSGESNVVTLNMENEHALIKILSSKLYSDPMRAFIRESISNAYDANVDSGDATKPIDILATQESGVYVISIRDHGNGINKEIFAKSYLKLGASTKTDTNEQIGAFGMGRLSALAVTNKVIIKTSYEENNEIITDTYHMYMKDSVHIDKIASTTSEFNQDLLGTEVTIYLNDYTKFYSARSDVETNYYMFNINYNKVSYGETRNKDIENRYLRNVLVNHDDFICKKVEVNSDIDTQIRNRHGLLLGNLYYEIQDSFVYNFYNIITKIENHKYGCTDFSYVIIPKFKIGELHLTPSRENILMDDYSTLHIETKFKELNKILIKELCKANLLHMDSNYIDSCNYHTIKAIPISINSVNNLQGKKRNYILPLYTFTNSKFVTSEDSTNSGLTSIKCFFTSDTKSFNKIMSIPKLIGFMEYGINDFKFDNDKACISNRNTNVYIIDFNITENKIKYIQEHYTIPTDSEGKATYSLFITIDALKKAYSKEFLYDLRHLYKNNIKFIHKKDLPEEFQVSVNLRNRTLQKNESRIKYFQTICNDQPIEETSDMISQYVVAHDHKLVNGVISEELCNNYNYILIESGNSKELDKLCTLYIIYSIFKHNTTLLEDDKPYIFGTAAEGTLSKYIFKSNKCNNIMSFLSKKSRLLDIIYYLINNKSDILYLHNHLTSSMIDVDVIKCSKEFQLLMYKSWNIPAIQNFETEFKDCLEFIETSQDAWYSQDYIDKLLSNRIKISSILLFMYDIVRSTSHIDISNAPELYGNIERIDEGADKFILKDCTTIEQNVNSLLRDGEPK